MKSGLKIVGQNIYLSSINFWKAKFNMSQYSIISALIRPEIGEKISVGLIMLDGDRVYFSYSASKLEIAKKLLSKSSTVILKDFIKNIETKVDGDKNPRYKDLNIFISHSQSDSFSNKYFDYLSRYSNNALSFSSPKDIKLEASKENFRLLFYKFIEIESQEAVYLADSIPKLKPVQLLRSQYKERLTKHFNIEREIAPHEIDNLIAPVKIDFVGRNGIDVFVQTLDMEGHANKITTDLGNLALLKTAYDLNDKSNCHKDFLLAKEPSKKLKKQHEIWTEIKENRLFEYVDMSESDRIVEYAEENGVVPLFSE